MSHFVYNSDEYEYFLQYTPCSTCNGVTAKCNGMCNGSVMSGTRRRTPEDVAMIKAERAKAQTTAAHAELTALRDRVREAREHIDILANHPAHDGTAMQRRAFEWLRANPGARTALAEKDKNDE